MNNQTVSYYPESFENQLEDSLLTDFIVKDLHYFIKRINDNIRELRKLDSSKQSIDFFKELRKKYFIFYNKIRENKVDENYIKMVQEQMNNDIQLVG